MRYVALTVFVAVIAVLCGVLINIYTLGMVGVVGAIGVGVAAILCAVVITAKKEVFHTDARIMASFALIVMAVLAPAGFSTGMFSSPVVPATVMVEDTAPAATTVAPQVYIEKK